MSSHHVTSAHVTSLDRGRGDPCNHENRARTSFPDPFPNFIRILGCDACPTAYHLLFRQTFPFFPFAFKAEAHLFLFFLSV